MAAKVNLVIDQGSDFSVDLNIKDDYGDVLPLNDYTANSQIRKWYTSTTAAATFQTSINVEAGIITLSLNNSQTSNLIAGRYVYDLEINLANTVTRIVEGIVTVTPEVTR
jgi:hypothetical protein